MLIAVTRAVSPSIGRCELTHVERLPIDVERAVAQHGAHERLLASCGATIVRAPAAPDQPDAVFIEDTAIVLDEAAVLTRPGAASRRAETGGVASALAPFRNLLEIREPATLDGGDVLRLGRTLYAGRSSRTGDAGIAQLRERAVPFGYRVVAVELTGCLHLKSAVTAVADGLLLVNPAWVSPAAFPGWDAETVDPGEPAAANVLRIGQTVLVPEAAPRTRDRLARRGLRVETIACDELAKAEGGLTCCSLLFEERAA